MYYIYSAMRQLISPFYNNFKFQKLDLYASCEIVLDFWNWFWEKKQQHILIRLIGPTVYEVILDEEAIAEWIWYSRIW